jgi:hypothetical protein
MFDSHGWTVIANQIAKVLSYHVRTGGGGTLMPRAAKAFKSTGRRDAEGCEELLAELGGAAVALFGLAILHARTYMCDMHVRACPIRV